MSFNVSEDCNQTRMECVDALYPFLSLLKRRVDYYLMLNNIQVEDLGIKEEEFTVEKKHKFIQNCSSKFLEGSNVIRQMFITMKVAPLPPSEV